MESLDLQVPLVWMANQGLQDQKGKRVKQGTSARGWFSLASIMDSWLTISLSLAAVCSRAIKVEMEPLAPLVHQDPQVPGGLLVTQEKMAQEDLKAPLVLKASQGRTALWVPGDPRGQRASPACKGRRVMMASQGNQDFQALREKREARV